MNNVFAMFGIASQTPGLFHFSRTDMNRTEPTHPLIGENARGPVARGHGDIRTTHELARSGDLPMGKAAAAESQWIESFGDARMAYYRSLMHSDRDWTGTMHQDPAPIDPRLLINGPLDISPEDPATAATAGPENDGIDWWHGLPMAIVMGLLAVAVLVVLSDWAGFTHWLSGAVR